MRRREGGSGREMWEQVGGGEASRSECLATGFDSCPASTERTLIGSGPVTFRAVEGLRA